MIRIYFLKLSICRKSNPKKETLHRQMSLTELAHVAAIKHGTNLSSAPLEVQEDNMAIRVKAFVDKILIKGAIASPAKLYSIDSGLKTKLGLNAVNPEPALSLKDG